MLHHRHGRWIVKFYILITFLFPITCQLLDKIVPLLQLIDKNTQELSSDRLNYHNKFLPMYDFIIIGAGTAGCVLANRLTENPNWNVLLVEAGDNEKFFMDIPITLIYNQLTSADWKYKTEPSNKYCTGLKNKQCSWPRGKVMGGSSVLNYMIYSKGSQGDYDNWKAMGNDGWGWQDVQPYFKKVENFNIPSQFDPKYHGRNGYANIEYAPYQSNLSAAWIQAAEELGFNNVDYNGAEPSGVSRLQFFLKNGTRQSSNRAYLHPIKDRPNLYLSKNSFVTKIFFDHSNSVAMGIEVEKNNKTFKVLANKEVIVSAGAINSPQLLMLSGIGPKDHLNTMEIDVIKDLPVGYNLMDHIAAGGLHFIVDTYIECDNSTNDINKLLEWMKDHKGPLSVPSVGEAIIYMNLKDKFNSSLSPDIELAFMAHGLAKDYQFQHILGIDDKIQDEILRPLEKHQLFLVFPMLVKPKSRGRIMLRNRDPKIHPKLIPNYLDYDEDLHKIVEAIKVAIKISEQPSMKNLGTKLYNAPIKECLKEGAFGSDAYFACQTRMLTLTIYHQSGTCKMGVANDQSAVVDPRLKVHGIKNLRIIDASIMPEIVSVHTNAPTYMIAEKGADMIKQDWQVL